ncbi:MAG: ABC transporter substrate-binding protein [Dehalococcoidia bacterium]|nr:ABC transporter substrate-binding protein [Dehalococcoidia bacterium]
MRTLAWALALAAACLLAGACAAPTPTPEPTPTPTFAPTPTADVGPPSDGALRVAAVGAAPHRDLHRLVSEWATLFGPGLAYSRLLRFEAGPRAAQPGMHVACDLCQAWRVSPDGLTYEFDLHPDAAWASADGALTRGVTAQDVAFSLERLRTPGLPHAWLLAAVEDIEVASDAAVRLRLRYPDADLPQKLASPYAVVMAPEAVGADLRTGPVISSGPWLFDQGASGQVWLTAREDYHRPGEPSVSALEIVPVRDFATGAAFLRAGQVDAAQVSAREWAELAGGDIRSVVVRRQGFGVAFGMNVRDGPLADAAVRRALFAALDPWAALGALDRPAWVGVGVPVIEPDWLLPDEELRRVFRGEQAGGGVAALTLTVANFGEGYAAHGEALAAQMRDTSFDVTVEVVSRSAYFQRVWEERDFEAFVGPLPPVTTTGSFLLGLVHGDGAQNVFGHQDAALDALIEAQAAEPDAARRGVLVREAQQRILDDAFLFMPAIAAERWAYGPGVIDFAPNMPAGAGDFWRYARLEEASE